MRIITLPYGETEIEYSEVEKYKQYCDIVFPNECRSCGGELNKCNCHSENTD